MKCKEGHWFTGSEAFMAKGKCPCGAKVEAVLSTCRGVCEYWTSECDKEFEVGKFETCTVADIEDCAIADMARYKRGETQ
jgi:hypothetical protein